MPNEEPHTLFLSLEIENAFVSMMYDFVMCTTRLRVKDY